jgi:UDP-glucose 4-epimerase
MAKRILVVGGAGYIGAHTAWALERAGYDALIFDNLSTGRREFLRFGRHIIGDLADKRTLDTLFSENTFDAVMHFASRINVGESVADPGKYYRANVADSLNLLEAVRDHGVGHFIFSSSAAVYGTPQGPLTEGHPLSPINPYGKTKAAVEWMLADFSAAYGLKYCALRYFNAAGAAPVSSGAKIGEMHEPETHLIPLVLQAARKGGSATVFGADYPTPDGTCIRDYIHVCDLAEAHILAMQRLMSGEASAVFNLGNGRGFSVREVIEAARKVTGINVAMREAPRRPGDPDTLVSVNAKALTELGWKPRFADLEYIVQTAWDWERARGW